MHPGYELQPVGWKNYSDALFVDPLFNQVLTDSVLSMVIDVPLILFFSLFAAVLLNQKFRGRAAARAILFLPVILASGAIASAEEAGLINLVGNSQAAQELGESSQMLNTRSIMIMLDSAGLPKWFVEYLVQAVTRIYEIIRSSGVQILIFLAALQSVPSTLYEVAKIEGATPYETFWKITFPMVSPLILTNVIYSVIDSFAQSEVTNKIYETAFTAQNFGLSAAMSWLYTLTVSILLIIISVMISRRVFYHN